MATRLAFPLKASHDIPQCVTLHKGWLSFGGLEPPSQQQSVLTRRRIILMYLHAILPCGLVGVMHAINFWAIHHDQQEASAVSCFVADYLPGNVINIFYAWAILECCTSVTVSVINVPCRGWIHVWHTLLESRDFSQCKDLPDHQRVKLFRIIYGLHVAAIIGSILGGLIASSLTLLGTLHDCSLWLDDELPAWCWALITFWCVIHYVAILMTSIHLLMTPVALASEMLLLDLQLQAIIDRLASIVRQSRRFDNLAIDAQQKAYLLVGRLQSLKNESHNRKLSHVLSGLCWFVFCDFIFLFYFVVRHREFDQFFGFWLIAGAMFTFGSLMFATVLGGAARLNAKPAHLMQQLHSLASGQLSCKPLYILLRHVNYLVKSDLCGIACLQLGPTHVPVTFQFSLYFLLEILMTNLLVHRILSISQ